MKELSLALIALFVITCTTQKVRLDGRDDPHLWLEDIEGEKSLSWVRSENKKTEEKFTQNKRFQSLSKDALKILQSKDKIPYVEMRGQYLYNFWQDEKHVRGILRRTTLASYKNKNPRWETVLDIDQLAKKEKQSWILKSIEWLGAGEELALVSLSRGGKDATEWREFNLKSKAFVKNGFFLKEAKSSVVWKDRNHILVSTDFGEGSLTESGYSRFVRLWSRSTGKIATQNLIEAKPKDMAAEVQSFGDGDKDYLFLSVYKNFFSSSYYLFENNKNFAIPLPASTTAVGVFRGYFLAGIKEDWKVQETMIKSGSLIAMNLEAARRGELKASDLQVIMNPLSNGSILEVKTTSEQIIINTLENVKGQIYGVKYEKGKFQKPKRFAFSLSEHKRLEDVSPAKADFFFSETGFITPSSLYYYQAKTNKAQKYKSLPAQFDARSMTVQQKWATSRDGTKIPYFVMGKKSVLKKGKAPTLLFGYGGFEYSSLPLYRPLPGKLWMERDGIYVVANIRGGGEFGPQWHTDAIKLNRQKAFDDFIAVGEDLVQTGITTREKLGIWGRSNGGLLVGTVMTQRPDLFKSVLCVVPLLDMIRYSQLLAGASWMGEYGDPRDSEMRDYLFSYSPYHNISAEKKYPNLFLVTSTKDDRVHPGHARKFAAKMQSLGHENLSYYEDPEGGHGENTDFREKAKVWAMSYEFLFETLFQ